MKILNVLTTTLLFLISIYGLSQSNPVFTEYPIDDSFVGVSALSIYGSEIKTLVDEIQNTGSTSVIWNGSDRNGNKIHRGIYICILNINDETRSFKIVFE